MTSAVMPTYARAPVTFAKGEGCADCNATGYRGRMGIFEIFRINEELQKMVYDNVGTSRLREKARALLQELRRGLN